MPEGRRLLPGLTVEDNLRVATYTMSREQAREGRARALALFPELEKRLGLGRAPALRAASSRWSCSRRRSSAEPKVVVIDELSLGLAPVVVSRLIPTLRAVGEDGTASS